jgi:hypothetical protein
MLVCGGRDFDDEATVFATLDAYHAVKPISVVIHGAAMGADMLAQSWADKRGVESVQFPAKWDRDGKAAGPIRNRLMLTEGKPDFVMAFAGGRGTANMIKQAKAAGVAVREL